MMDVSRLCSDLVKIPSENPPGSTEDVILSIEELLDTCGIRSTITRRSGGKCNLVTEPAATNLLLCGHVDVVPALDDGWSDPPFSGLIRNGAVWGRGSTDMKGGCAALLTAFLAFFERYGRAPAQLAFVCDEETGGECGIRHLIKKRLIAPCDCLIAEPTPACHPNIGQKGLVRLALRFSGSPGHGSLYPAVGTSAIAEALSFIEYLKRLHGKKFTHDSRLEAILTRSSEVLAEEFDLPQAGEVLSCIMFNPGVIRGGEKANIVAQRCDMEIEMRIPWGCDIPALLSDLRKKAPHCTIISETSHLPSLTPPDSLIATTTCAAIQQVYRKPAFPVVQWAASDARHLRCEGFNVIEYGPGSLRSLHAIDEHVPIESLEKAAEVYLTVLRMYDPDLASTGSGSMM